MIKLSKKTLPLKELTFLLLGWSISTVAATGPSCTTTPDEFVLMVKKQLSITLPKEVSTIIIYHLQPPRIRLWIYHLASLPHPEEQQENHPRQASLPTLVPNMKTSLMTTARKKYHDVIDVNLYYTTRKTPKDNQPYCYIHSQQINVPCRISNTISYDQDNTKTKKKQEKSYAQSVLEKYLGVHRFKTIHEVTTINGKLFYRLKCVVQLMKFPHFDDMKKLTPYPPQDQFKTLDLPVVGQLDCELRHFSFYHLLSERIWGKYMENKYYYYAGYRRPIGFLGFTNLTTLQRLNFSVTYSQIFNPLCSFLIYRHKRLSKFFKNKPIFQTICWLGSCVSVFLMVLSAHRIAAGNRYPPHLIDGAFVPLKTLCAGLFIFVKLLKERCCLIWQ